MDGALNHGILCLVPSSNSPGKQDATGAFLPQARAFAEFHGYSGDSVMRYFDPAQSIFARRASCNAALRALRLPIKSLAFFCHGYRRGLQAGYQTGHVAELAELLAAHGRMVEGGWVLLYACDTGRDADEDTQDDRLPGPGGDGGFADALRDALEKRRLTISVMAHTTRGHTTENPNVRRFVAGTGGLGGEWYVDPTSPLFQRWARALKDPHSTLKWRFPTMTPLELASELAAMA